jgi:hypothetical protein
MENQSAPSRVPAAKSAPAAASSGSGQGRSFDNFDDDIPF